MSIRSPLAIGALVVTCIVGALVVRGSNLLEDDEELPSGEQQLVGLLESAPLSVKRRGTHILQNEGGIVTYVESSTIRLSAYEDQVVELTGVYEPNTEGSIPVLVVSAVNVFGEEQALWKSADLELRISTPSEWDGQVSQAGITFTSDDLPDEFLRIILSPLTALPSGSSLRIDGQEAVMEEDEGMLEYWILYQEDVHHITFDPPSTLSAYEYQLLRQQVEAAIMSIRYEQSAIRSSQASSITPAPVSSGSAGSTDSAASQIGGQPCGGPAGILCPSGFYCEITDAEIGAGECRAL